MGFERTKLLLRW